MITRRTNVFLSLEGAVRAGDPASQEALLARGRTISAGILSAHRKEAGEGRTLRAGDPLRLTFDSLTSHDITYVGIIQTARASGLSSFPVPYVLTNCHNSLCAVGGTINEDDHAFALSAAKRYGGIYVPANMAVIHSYNREMMAGGGRMILGSDSHTRYGALGTMGVGEGGGELVKQLLKRTYDFPAPEVVAVWLTGRPAHGVGPQDVALSIIGAVFGDGFVKNRVMEFLGPGIDALPVEYRNAIDVMTTETACWSSIWRTDDKVKEYYRAHGREEDFRLLKPDGETFYERMIEVDLSGIRPMIALPFHPSNVYALSDFKQNAQDILHEAGLDALLSKATKEGVRADQGIIAGCSGGTFDNLYQASSILKGHSVGSEGFTMSAYAGSMPIHMQLMRSGAMETLLEAGVIMRECFCGPCFGAGDTPSNGALSIRHTTRNFPNREGSKPTEGQSAYVALMDARSIAATARNGGILTGADEVDWDEAVPVLPFDGGIYEKRVFRAAKPDASAPLVFGPNIKDWPEMPGLRDDLLVKVVSHIDDPVTTTDELIPSGETSSYRSNPLRLAEFTLSRRDPQYVGRAKAFPEQGEVAAALQRLPNAVNEERVTPGTAIYAVKPGDGSAREQAASCQRVLGGAANFAREYATKRYRSNLINWGILPFVVTEPVQLNEYVYVPGIAQALREGRDEFRAAVIGDTGLRPITLTLGGLTEEERRILLAGCLINHYRNENA